jgi:hypothetical protein
MEVESWEDYYYRVESYWWSLERWWEWRGVLGRGEEPGVGLSCLGMEELLEMIYF